MIMALSIVAGLLLGGFLGYMAGAFVACVVFETGNLCGLIGVFITGPIGSIAGGVGAWSLARRR
jgi:hypothetical protein